MINLTEENIAVLLIPMNLITEEDGHNYLQSVPIFSTEFFEYVRNCSSSQRKKEILLSRLILLYLLQTYKIRIYFYDSIKKCNELLEMSPSSQSATVNISLSHSNLWMAMALCRNSVIGIDIENSKRKIRYINRFFSEKLSLSEMQEDPSWLLSLWTLYEALTKMNVSDDIQRKILNTVNMGIKENLRAKDGGDLNYRYFFFCDYLIFMWEDGVIPGPGCVVTASPDIKNIEFYTINKKSTGEIKELCKLDLTEFFVFEKKLEVSF